MKKFAFINYLYQTISQWYSMKNFPIVLSWYNCKKEHKC